MATIENEIGTAQRWANARQRMRELLETDPDFAAEFRLAVAGPEPPDDELLSRARAGEFGDEVFTAQFGVEAADEVSARIREQ